MMIDVQPMCATDALAVLEEHLDLADVRMKLAHPDEGVGISPGEIMVMEREYRRFLVLHLLHPDADIVPCKVVDEMWHRHILDTAAYRTDCVVIFGRFLDHYPYFGMRSDQDAEDLAGAYSDTIAKYRAAFGEPEAGTWVSSDASSKCKRTACKPMRCR
jgi:hypothetical protein